MQRRVVAGHPVELVGSGPQSLRAEVEDVPAEGGVVPEQSLGFAPPASCKVTWVRDPSAVDPLQADGVSVTPGDDTLSPSASTSWILIGIVRPALNAFDRSVSVRAS